MWKPTVEAPETNISFNLKERHSVIPKEQLTTFKN